MLSSTTRFTWGSLFVQKTYPMGLRIDVTNVGKALEEIKGPSVP